MKRGRGIPFRGLFLAVTLLLLALMAYGCSGVGMQASSDSDNTSIGIFGKMENGCTYSVTEVLDENGNHQKVWGKISCGTD